MMMKLMRRLAELQSRFGFVVEPEHIPGVVHFRSDVLSRKDIVSHPLSPRLRLKSEYVHMFRQIWGGFDVVKGSEFRMQVSGRRQWSGVLPTGLRMWLHPRYDQVAQAVKWVHAAAARDLAADTKALIVLPLMVNATWFPLTKRMKCLLVIPASTPAVQQWTVHGWKSACTKYDT